MTTANKGDDRPKVIALGAAVVTVFGSAPRTSCG
jgi:hypothetical protein